MYSVLILILIPLISSILAFVSSKKWAGIIAVGASLISLFYFLILISGFNAMHEMTNNDSFKWIPGTSITFHVGMDASSIIMSLLTLLVIPLSLIATFTKKEEKKSSYYGSMLLTLSALLGFFSAQNPLTFYLFFEITLIPIYFIVLMYGGVERKKAVFEFFIYTVFGSLIMLGGLIFMHYKLGANQILDWSNLYYFTFDLNTQYWIFAALFIAFAIKSPLFPFHSWQVKLYSQADRQTMMVIAGILSKMGVYGLLRFNFVFPDALQQLSPYLIPLCIFGVIYGALIAWRQTDITKLLAYSSLSHLGLITAAILSNDITAQQGSLFQMFSHGLVAAALFFVADVLIQRTDEQSIMASSGLAKDNPRIAVYFFIIVLASIGLPMTSGFVGEFYMLWGMTKVNIWYGVLGGLTIILSAIYMLRFYQKSMFGEAIGNNKISLPLRLNEEYVFIIVVILVISLGVFPKTWIDLSKFAVSQFINVKSNQ